MPHAHDRVLLCRCFDGERAIDRRDGGTYAPKSVHESPAIASESAAFLRPDVDCLQRWLDLNA